MIVEGLHRKDPRTPTYKNERVTEDNRFRMSSCAIILSKVTLGKTAEQEELAIEQEIEDTSMKVNAKLTFRT